MSSVIMIDSTTRPHESVCVWVCVCGHFLSWEGTMGPYFWGYANASDLFSKRFPNIHVFDNNELLQSNDVSYWLGANLESALIENMVNGYCIVRFIMMNKPYSPWRLFPTILFKKIPQNYYNSQLCVSTRPIGYDFSLSQCRVSNVIHYFLCCKRLLLTSPVKCRSVMHLVYRKEYFH